MPLSFSFKHPGCFNVPRNLKVDAATFVTEHLDDQTEDLILSDSAKCEEIIQAIESKGGGKGKGGGESNEENAVSKKIDSYRKILETIREGEEEGEVGERPMKKAKKEVISKELSRAAKALRVYEKMKNAELQDVLRWNLGYGMTGTKDVLLLR